MLLILITTILVANANAFVTQSQQHRHALIQQRQQQQQQQSPPDAKSSSSASRPTSTSHSLFPFSVATTVDAWAFPWAMPDLKTNHQQQQQQQDAYYTSSLQSAAWSRRRRLVFPKDDVSFGDDNNSNHNSPLIPLVVRPRAKSSLTTTSFQQQQQRRFRVYCDLDGVLVDFCHGIRTLFPTHEASQSVDALHRPTMWQKVAAQPAFFAHLPWMPEGRRLWQAIRPLKPDILTGVPYRVSRSSVQKYDWCRRELGVPVQHIDKAFGRAAVQQSSSANAATDVVCRVITTWSNDKHVESGPGAVLIDDRIELKAAWEAKGGIFIHHSPGNVDHTLAQLRHHGVLPATEV